MKTPGLLLSALAVWHLNICGAEAAVTRAMVIRLDIPAPDDSAGGILVADVNDNGRPDYLVTVPGHLAVYDNAGKKRWIAWERQLRTRATAPNVLVRERRWATVRRYSKLCRFGVIG